METTSESHNNNYSNEIGNGNNDFILQQGTNNTLIVNKFYGYFDFEETPFFSVDTEILNGIKGFHELEPEQYNYRKFYSQASDDVVQWWGQMNDAVAEREVTEEILNQCYNGLESYEPVLVWIEGSGGMGKSTLLKSITKTLTLENGFSICWIKATSWEDFEMYYKSNKNKFLDFNLICIDQLDDEQDKASVLRWLQKVNLGKTKVLIAGRPMQKTIPNLLVNGIESIFNLDNIKNKEDNFSLVNKLASKIKEWKNVVKNENFVKLKPFQLIFVLQRQEHIGIEVNSIEEIIKYDLELLANDSLYSGFKDSLGILACLYNEFKNVHFSKEAFLWLTNYLQKSDIVENLNSKPIESWDYLSVLQYYISTIKSPKDKKNIVPESIVFNHDDLLDSIFNCYEQYYPKQYERRKKSIFNFIINNTDMVTSSRYLYYIGRYTNYFTNEEIVSNIRKLIEKKNSHHSYISILFYPQEVSISEKERELFIEEYFNNISTSNLWVCSHTNNWLNSKSNIKKNEWIKRAVEEWKVNYVSLIEHYISNILTDVNQRIKFIIGHWNSYSEEVQLLFLKLLKRNNYNKEELEKLAIELFSKGRNEEVKKALFKFLERNNYAKKEIVKLAIDFLKNTRNETIKVELINSLERFNYDKEELVKLAISLFEKTKNENVIIQLIKWLEQSNYDKEKLKEKAVNLFEKAKNENVIIELIKWLEQSNYDKEKLKEKAVNLFEKAKNEYVIIQLIKWLEQSNYDKEKLKEKAVNLFEKAKNENIIGELLIFLERNNYDNAKLV
ncbi:ATP-binding protein, partial [Lacihabitans sp. LS3-19]|uniref:ATP-binding protein n=1 Tax=Lacihabitans sp. LS3-19 TaxID=2487335 RepID=UPI0020CF1382